jgi:oxygen-independent coproporphyrinogen-3 oxidase
VSLSVYIHLPYCARKCPYCDFNVHIVNRIPEDRYTNAIQREIRAASAAEPWHGRAVTTVFFGGGTPSLFSPTAIARILQTLDQCLSHSFRTCQLCS